MGEIEVYFTGGEREREGEREMGRVSVAAVSEDRWLSQCPNGNFIWTDSFVDLLFITPAFPLSP